MRRKIMKNVPVAQEERCIDLEGYMHIVNRRSRGQALLIVALMMTVLILFAGLGVDVGNLMGKRAKLQSAVDAATLSAAEMIGGSSSIYTSTKASQILEANGVLSPTLVSVVVDTPVQASNQVHVKVVQRIDTFFMRIIPMWRQVDISAEATADLNNYAEVNAKPYGQPGVVNELNLSVWGKNSWRKGGDAYSPLYENSGGTIINNPEYPKQPYGYLYRIDVPASYTADDVVVQIFDADGYNRPDAPVTPTNTPIPTPFQTPRPTYTPSGSDYRFTGCPSYDNNNCTTSLNQPGYRYNTGLKLNAYPDQRPAFWRADEDRRVYSDSDINPVGNSWDNTWATTTQYTLWHFDPRVTSAFGYPDDLSDQPANAGPCGSPTFPTLRKCLAQYTADRTITKTDLKWYQPDGFKVVLRNGPGCTKGTGGNECFDRETTGGFYFYLYVQGIDGSSENNFDLRVGPSSGNILCDNTTVTTGNMYQTDCYVNQLYYDNSYNGLGDWNTGGASVFAKRAMALNLDTGTQFPMLFTQVSKNAAGQTLGIRHFDQDCNSNGGCDPPITMTYQMQKCGATDLNNDASFADVATGYVGNNDAWVCAPGACPDPEGVLIPNENSQFFKASDGTICATSWLRLKKDPSYTQDTTVWEMPFIRPRLVK